MTKARVVASIVVVLGSLGMGACGVYVWPTRYKPVALERQMGFLAAREDRFTGHIDVLTVDSGGWLPLDKLPPPRP